MFKKDQQKWSGLAILMASILLLVGLSAPMAVADEPEWEMEVDMKAPNLNIATYDVKADNEVDFMEAVMHSGGYVGKQPGFSVEKVVRSVDGPVDGVVRFWVVTRHYNVRAMEMAQEERDQAVAPYIASQPKSFATTINNHQVSNWGLERHEKVEFTKAATMTRSSVFDEYGTSLAFFKYGYTGQLAWIQEHSETAQKAAEGKVLQHEGLSGVSVAKAADGPVVTYAEFFATPETLSRQAKASGGISGIGTVVLNYRER